MKLTIYYDGQFYVGLVETVSNHHLKAFVIFLEMILKIMKY
ncbi:DUF2992 family protein [Heyndrickxia oleronia]|nr:DUF2992 family protein [Heyndrickxia oleronia]GIN37147.1 hypothetical protein J19TS1_00960 [Heyndrickxia oleronia]